MSKTNLQPVRANRAIECAKDYTADDDAVAVDDGAHVEKVDGGYWVAARVWVSDAVFEAHVSWAEARPASV